jgi:hypothetical protein
MDIVNLLKKNKLVAAGLIAVVLVVAYFYVFEGLENTTAAPTTTRAPVTTAAPTTTKAPVTTTKAPVTTAAPKPLTVAQQQAMVDKLVAGQTQLTTKDLLPKYDAASDFVKQNPTTNLLHEQNFLQAGYHVGIQTQVSSNKIPYLDIRSCPPIAKDNKVSPFLNSSYENPTGFGRRKLEISD